ncbi:uncharacterized protein [Rutidosis leptorrhynchoides]|uniref:uncharacterized protein n=1 Tax=Rutidosis leptorrhynchoides TaxID=125765 RepID=UPI003A99D206
MILSYLHEDNSGKPRTTKYGGHFVTLIAQSLGIDLTGLHSVNMKELGMNDYIKGNILKENNLGSLVRYFAEASDNADMEEPRQYGQAPVDYTDVMLRLGRIELGQEEDRRSRLERAERVDAERKKFNTGVMRYLGDMSREITAVRYDQQWGNYRSDVVTHHYLSTQATLDSDDPMDVQFKRPRYYTHPHHPAYVPTFDWGGASTSTSLSQLQQQQGEFLYYQRKRRHNRVPRGGP